MILTHPVCSQIAPKKKNKRKRKTRIDQGNSNPPTYANNTKQKVMQQLLLKEPTTLKQPHAWCCWQVQHAIQHARP